MNLRKFLIAVVGLLTSLHVFATGNCRPGVYSDGAANAAVLRNEPEDGSGIRYLMLDGVFGNTQSESIPFKCQSKFIRLNNSAATPLKLVSPR